MEQLNSVLTKISDFLWGPPLMVALIGTGLFLTFRLGFVQFRYMFKALGMIFMPPHDKSSPGEISHFQALMTALAATVGTGNIAGVATAIAMGGPGAMFWMWVTGLVGMATKFSEAVLAIRYRDIGKDGKVSGGPMYYIQNGLGMRWLAVIFAVCASIAAFGIGNMVQSNSVAEALNGAFGVPHYATGIVLAVFTGLVLIGGIQSIGSVTQILVPFMIGFYLISSIIAIAININLLPLAFKTIMIHAFTGEAVWGGVTGAGVREAMRYGLARGLLSNESGLGSSPIAAAAARTDHPVTQALVSMTQTFIDTIIVCSMTGFVIVISQVSDGSATGARLSALAFNSIFGSSVGSFITAVSLATFAYSTILGWSYYGEKSIEFLGGRSVIKYYRILFVIFAFLGCVLKLETVWTFSDVMNALMALPNLLALILLSGEIRRLYREYFKILK